MQFPTVQPTRTLVLPVTGRPVIKQRTAWPFPAGVARRRTDDVLNTAQVVIATTARAYLTLVTQGCGT